MSKTIQPVIAELFQNGKPHGRSLDFTWRLVWRRRRPFLLLPVSATDVRVSLALYSAQRKRAKIWRAVLPLVFNTPAAAVFQRVHFQADESSEVVGFLSEQSGVPVDQLQTPAIKFGGMEIQKSRLVLLACDQTRRPAKVIKLGLDAAGRAATEREADLLEKLPVNTLGCIRTTGRLTTPKISAFATAYFPGESPEDDAGMETLFHSWINPEPAGPIERLDSWHELETVVANADPGAWQALRPALAGKTVRSTLYHGDFAPWNIRAVNSQNLQAFDWERGSLHGIPAWDWFHFIVQTAILARRYSVERAAAEVEELLQSPRFEKYAAAAGISPIVKPLLLAYLLHHRWVIQPLEGRETTAKLQELLAARWGFMPPPQSLTVGKSNSVPAQACGDPPRFWADAVEQLKSAWAQLANVFWEPKLTAKIQPSLQARFLARWPTALFCCLWLAAVAGLHFFYLNHQMLLPFYAVPCLVAAWKMGRRWGTLFAAVTACIGPALTAMKDPDTYPTDLVCWNSAMRFLILQMCAFLTDRIHRQRDFFRRRPWQKRRPAKFAENWAVVLTSTLLFLVIAWGDFYTGPRVNFLPLYLFPAMLITLFLDLRWGTLVVLLGALNACAGEYVTKYNASVAQVFGWNLTMRFLILFLVILLLDQVRQENVLFTSRKQNGAANGTKPG